ncbi:MAG: head-tail adaptor protein [Ruminiclostridium sp.]
MSLGRMNTFISICKPTVGKDTEGFPTKKDVVIANVRAYREGRHGSEKWANRAVFSEATDLFRFRCIPDTEIVADMVILCGAHRFEITSVENVKGRGMYMEVLCKEVKPGG